MLDETEFFILFKENMSKSSERYEIMRDRKIHATKENEDYDHDFQKNTSIKSHLLSYIY